MKRMITEEILNNMICDYNNGYSLEQLNEKYGFKKQTIRKHFRNYGLEEFKINRHPYHYTEDDIEFLKIYYPIGDWDSIFKRFPNIAKSSINSKMSDLNIKNEVYRWTNKDVELLKENYGKLKPCELVSLFDNRHTYKAISTKAKKLNLCTRKFWTDEEINIMKENYSNCSIEEMMKLLPNRSRHSIIGKAVKLKLKNKTILDYRFSDEEKMFVVNNYETMSDREISEKLGRSETSINNYRFRNKLIKTYENSSYNDLSEYIRRNNLEWKEKSMKNCNYKCVLTGNRFDDIHHIYGLNLILKETLKDLNINIKETMDDYTDQELRLILDAFRTKQNNYPLGVCLTSDIHKQFHDKYGYGNNTIEQWNEFIQDYYNLKIA